MCPWLLKELVELGLWNDDMKNMLIANNGSIQSIDGIPDDVKAIYKTVWGISQKKILDLAADRGAFICQSQSLNIHLQSPTNGQLTSMHFYGWKKGLKTGLYYLRTRPAAQAIQFTVDASYIKGAKKSQDELKGRKTNGVAASPIPRVVSSVVPSAVSSPITPSTVASSVASPTITSSTTSSSSTAADVLSNGLEGLSLDEKTRKAAEADPEFAAALRRKRDKEEEQAKLLCSLENPESCVMCSG